MMAEPLLRLKEIRRRKGMTQRELAAAAGLHQSALSRIERGERHVTLHQLQRLAQALRVPMSRLLA